MIAPFFNQIKSQLGKLSPRIAPNLTRNSTLSLADGLISFLSYFLVMKYLIAMYGLSSLGVWSLTMGFVSLVRVVDFTGAGGLSRMVALYGGDNTKRTACIDSHTLLILGLYSILGIIAYFPLEAAILSSVDETVKPQVKDLFLIAIISLPINITALAQLSAIDGTGRADIRSILNILSYVFYAILALILLPSYGLIGLAIAQLTQYLFGLTSARIVLCKFVPTLTFVPSKLSKDIAKTTVHYGLRLQASSIPMAIFDPVIRILLGRWLGLEQLAIYDLSYKLAAYLRNLFVALLNPFVPEFTRLLGEDIPAAKALYAKVNSMTVLAASLCYSLLILGSPILSWILLSEFSLELLFYISFLAITWGITMLGLTAQLYARAAGMLRWSIGGNWAILGLSLPLAYVVFTWLENRWFVLAISISIVAGHMIAYIGEIAVLKLSNFGDKPAILPKLSFILMLCIGLGGILIAVSYGFQE